SGKFVQSRDSFPGPGQINPPLLSTLIQKADFEYCKRMTRARSSVLDAPSIHTARLSFGASEYKTISWPPTLGGLTISSPTNPGVSRPKRRMPHKSPQRRPSRSFHAVETT